MEALLGIVIGLIVAAVVTAWLFLMWLYDRESLPPPGVIVQDLRLLRALLRINQVSDQAIAAMREWATYRR